MRQVLGPDFEASDQEIQESLWHYYYDVEKTTNYLLSVFFSIIPETVYSSLILTLRRGEDT